jgi:hypothetical protein
MECPDDGEDARSIELHISAMQQSWSSRSRDIELITDRMKRTYLHLRNSVDERATLTTLLDTYPGLPR